MAAAPGDEEAGRLAAAAVAAGAVAEAGAAAPGGALAGPAADPASSAPLPPEDGPVIFSVGHSTRSVVELVQLLKEHGVKMLVDVRTVPKSRTNPQHNKDKLGVELPQKHGVKYVWLGKQIGGLRKPNKEDPTTNAGWDNDSFRGYADYMQTPAFEAGLGELLRLARQQGPVALMCAEVTHFTCHRRLLADALAVWGITVQHVTAAGKPTLPHQLTPFAKVEGEHKVTYPAYEHEAKHKKKGPMDAFVTKKKRSRSPSSPGKP